MSRNVVRRLKLTSKLLRPSTSLAATRTLHSSSRCHFAATLGEMQSVDTEAVSRPRRNLERLKKQRLEDLNVILAQEKPQPAQVWGRYLDLLSLVHPEEVPLEVHQLVLRKSTLPPAESRRELYARIAMKRRPRAPHVHESRYQAIINNMREGGYTPDVEDYHFVMEQFAAVGHHIGALQVLQEMTHLKLEKTHKTYGLCLMSLAHRLTLPIYYTEREKMCQTMSRICIKLINEMWANQVPVTPFNVDQTLRILKETMDYEAFQKLLKIAYGIDLAYPDRPPLEYWDRDATVDGSASDVRNPAMQQPFSTSALNSTLDFLGRIGNISKLVQAFEVLTTPLPAHAVASPESSYADDSDEDFGVNDPFVIPYTPPHAKPNTTSYQLMIKWLSRAGRASLARHYLVQVMEQDRLVDRELRGECLRKRKGEILAPHLGITKYMFLPILGEANRDKDLAMLRFVLRKIRRALRRKRFDIEFYTEVQRRWREEEEAARAGLLDAVPHVNVATEVSSESAADATPATGPAADVTPTAEPAAELLTEVTPAPSPPVEATISPSPSLSSSVSTPTSASPSTRPPHFSTSSSSSPSGSLEQVPFESIPEPESATSGEPRRQRLFNVDLHLAILLRDQKLIEELEKQAADTLGRVVQRVKERLGRRIWEKKDVFLRSVNRRTRLSRDVWREIVRFKPTRAVPDRDEAPQVHPYRRPHAPPGHVAAQVGFFTSSGPERAERIVRRSTPGANATQGTATASASSAIVDAAAGSPRPSAAIADEKKEAGTPSGSS